MRSAWLALPLLLGACSGYAPEDLAPYRFGPEEPHGTLVIARDNQLTGSAGFLSILIAGRPVTNIAVGTTQTVQAPVGTHVVGLECGPLGQRLGRPPRSRCRSRPASDTGSGST